MSASCNKSSSGDAERKRFSAMVATVEVSLSEMSRMLSILEREIAEMTVSTTITKAHALQVLFDAPPPESRAPAGHNRPDGPNNVN